MSKKKRSASKSKKALHGIYANELRAEKNRKKRIAKHLKKHPNDAQTVKAATKPKAKRSASKSKGNFPPAKFILRDSAGNNAVDAAANKKKS